MFTFAPFCPDWLKICHDGRRMKTGGGEGVRLYMGAYNNRHPPPIWGAKTPFTPIIFRTKNTAKSRLGLIGKNFGKNLWENVSGEEKPPILWRGG